MPIELPPGVDADEFRKWPPAAQQKALSMLEKRKDPPRIWFCERGRECDGRPHEDANYPHARADQWPPEGVDWFVWALLSGRGAGKTRSGAEWLRKMSQYAPRMAMVGRRGPDVRGTMVEGPSGLIYVCERAGMSYTWEPSKKEFTFGNGSKVIGYSAEEPDTLRGPQHGIAWLDEPAHMPLIEAVWDNLLLGLRLDIPGGSKVLVTSTPTPIKWLKELVKDSKSRVIRVSTYKNLDNLDPNFRDNILKKYEGTRLGKQELHGEILQDVEGALWNWDLIERNRHKLDGQTLERFGETMDRIVVGVDPAGTSRRKSDETGIVVVGKRGDCLYILQDASGHYTPKRWASRAIDLYDHWNADALVVERNYGGEMVRDVMDNISKFPRVREVNSTRGKLIRAEPVFSLYEQDRVKHLPNLADLETQLTEWIPGSSESPDRMDAMVHAAHELSDHARPAEVQVASGSVANRNRYKAGRSPSATVSTPGRITRPTVRSWM